MEFSYRVSEQDFRESQKAYSRQIWRRDGKRILLWASILVALLMCWGIVHQMSRAGKTDENAPSIATQGVNPEPLAEGGLAAELALLSRDAPIVPLSGLTFVVWLLWMLGAGKRRALHNYRNNPLMRGVFTVDVSPQGMTVTNTAGTSSKTGWNIYEYWIEGTNVFVLVLRSKLQFVISTSKLSSQQRDELSAILGQALPKR